MAIRHKRTTTTGYTWQSGDTVEGQIGLNLTDGTLHFKKANGVYVNISESSGGLTDIVQDTTPQLGGNLDVNGNAIVSASNGNIELAPNGTGDVYLTADTVRVGDSNAAATVTTNGTGDLTLNTNSGTNSGSITIANGANGDITITPNGTGGVIIDGNEFPQTQGAKDDILVADGGGLLEWKKPEKLMAYVYNADSVQINKGEPVYVFSAQGDQISVKRALNTSDATSAQTLGLANENIAATASGYVVCQGPLTGIDTSTPGYSAGQALYLGATAGSVTTTKPSEPNHLVYLGFVEKVNASAGRIYVRVQNGYELAEIHDVNINNATALADNHYLRYNSSNTRWENAALDIVNDTTPQLGGNLDVNGNSIVSTSNGNITLAPNGTGKVVISGDLQIDGTTTTVNSTTLDVDDINITIAKGAANAAAANGGGITLEGPTTAATITYASADDSWNLNKKTSVTELQVDNININGNTIISTNTNGSINLTPNGTGDVFLNADTVNFGESGSSILKSAITDFELASSQGFTKIVATEGDVLSSIANRIQLLTDAVAIGKSGSNAIIHGFANTGSLILWGYADTAGTGSGGKIDIGSAANSNIEIAPNGTGDVYLTADTVRVGDSGANATITTNGAGDLILNTNSGTNSGSITIQDGANGNMLLDANGSGVIVVNNAGTGISLVRRSASTGTQSNALGVQRNFTANTLSNMNDHMAALAFSMRDSASTQSFFTRIGGVYSTSNAHQIAFERSTDNFTTSTRFATMASNAILLGPSTGTDAQNISTVTTQNLVLSTNQNTTSGSITIANGANGNITIATNGTGDVYVDADTLRIGDSNSDATITTNGTGDLILNTNAGTNSGSITIADAANGNITIAPNGTGQTKITNLQYNETVYAIGNSGTSTLTPDAANGPIQTITATGNFTLSAFSNPVSGQTITFVITQDGTGSRTLTSTMKFAGGSKTLSTAANSIDILTVSYIGTTYYATLSKGYA